MKRKMAQQIRHRHKNRDDVINIAKTKIEVFEEERLAGSTQCHAVDGEAYGEESGGLAMGEMETPERGWERQVVRL